MTTPARPSAPRRLGGGPLGILLGTLATLAFVPVLGSLFGLVGLGIPCEGFLCSIGLALYGAIAGAALGLVLGGVAGWFCGLRWWFIPGFVLGVVAGGMAFSALAIPIESSWPWLLPILPLAAVLASRLPTRPRLLASGILGAVLVLGVGVGVFVVGRTSAVAAASRAVAAARTDGVGILAPVGHDEFVVSAVVHEPPPTGPYLAYDLTELGQPGTVRVLMDRVDAFDSCGDGSVLRAWQLGDPPPTGGVDAIDRVCVPVPGGGWAVLFAAEPEIIAGENAGWRGRRLVDLAEALRPDDGAWVVGHAR